MTTERQIGLRKRTRPFTQIPNDAVDDFTIGYRELGLLVRILRMPDGFVIRSEQLSTEGRGKTLRGRKADREGREAVRTALRNLALAGYYRLVRIRFPDGTFAMATDISEEPQETWAAQATVFAGKPVLLYRQEDGSDQVKYPDGTMLPDDSMPPAEQLGASQDTADEPTPEPKPRNPSSAPKPGNPSPGNAEPGEAESGNSGPLVRRVSKDGQQDSVPASQVRPGVGDDGGQDGQMTITGEVEPVMTTEPTDGDIAASVARSWVEYRAKEGKPVAGNRPIVQVRALLLPFVQAKYTQIELKKALNGIGEGLPSRGQMQRALDTIRSNGTPGGNGRPIQQRGSGSRVNDHWRNQDESVMVGANAPAAAPRADRIRTDNPAW